MEETVDILEIFNTIVDPGVQHCRICFRTSKEIKLVEPIYLLEFSHTIKRRIFGSSGIEKSACYMCEAAAKAAVKLRNAICVADAIKSIMNNLSQNKPRIKGYMYRPKGFPVWLTKMMPENASRLATYRQRTTLRQTEVLLVDSNSMNFTITAPKEVSSGNVEATDQNHSKQQPQAPNPIIETVVLDDDDDSVPETTTKAIEATTQTKINNSKNIPNNMTKLAPKLPILVELKQLLEKPHEKRKDYAAIVPNRMQLMCGHETLRDNFLLHPMVTSVSGSLTVPSIGAEVIDGKLVHNPLYFVPLPVVNNGENLSRYSDIIDTIKTNLPQTPTQNKQIQTSSANNNVQKRGIQIQSTQSLNNKINNNDRLSNKKTNETCQENLIVELSEVDCVLDNALLTKKRRKDKVTETYTTLLDIESITNILSHRADNSSPAENPLGIIADVRSEREEPIKISSVTSRAPKSAQSSKIDWEDKIPMDVISFMDATDPNAEREMIIPDQLPRRTSPEITMIKSEANPIIDLC